MYLDDLNFNDDQFAEQHSESIEVIFPTNDKKLVTVCTSNTKYDNNDFRDVCHIGLLSNLNNNNIFYKKRCSFIQDFGIVDELKNETSFIDLYGTEFCNTKLIQMV